MKKRTKVDGVEYKSGTTPGGRPYSVRRVLKAPGSTQIIVAKDDYVHHEKFRVGGYKPEKTREVRHGKSTPIKKSFTKPKRTR